MDDEDEEMSVAEIVAALELDNNPGDRGGDSAPLGATPVRWRDLPDEQAREHWIALRDWVQWVTTRYDVPVALVPPCWWKHGALVEELSALHTAWNASFDRTDAGFGPVGWHERWALAPARLRAAYSGSCSSGHQPVKPRAWAAPTDGDEWDAWTSQAHGT